MTKYYVSVTGLRVKSVWHMPTFIRYAVSSMSQAQAAEGNVSAETKALDGIHHTLTVWQDKTSMRLYMINGAHRDAMKISDSISSVYGTKVYGYESEHIPTWEEALALWEEHGTRHGKKVLTQGPVQASVSSLTKAALMSTGAVLLLTAAYLHTPESIATATSRLDVASII